MESRMQKFYRRWWSGFNREAKFADWDRSSPPAFDADFDKNGGSK